MTIKQAPCRVHRAGGLGQGRRRRHPEPSFKHFGRADVKELFALVLAFNIVINGCEGVTLCEY